MSHTKKKDEACVELEMIHDFDDNQAYLREYLEVAWEGNGYLPRAMREACRKIEDVHPLNGKVPGTLSNDTVGMLCNLTSIVLGGGVPLSSLWEEGGALTKALAEHGPQLSQEVCKAAIANYNKTHSDKKLRGASDDLLGNILEADGEDVVKVRADGKFNVKAYVERLEAQFEAKGQESGYKYKALAKNARVASLCFTRWVLYITSPNVQRVERELEIQEESKKRKCK